MNKMLVHALAPGPREASGSKMQDCSLPISDEPANGCWVLTSLFIPTLPPEPPYCSFCELYSFSRLLSPEKGRGAGGLAAGTGPSPPLCCCRLPALQPFRSLLSCSLSSGFCSGGKVPSPGDES